MKLGFIGCGNMAKAMISGIVGNGVVNAGEIIASALHEESRRAAAEVYGIAVTADNGEVAEKAETLFLAIKPQFYETVIDEIRDKVRDGQVIVSLAPGKTVAWLEERFGKAVKVVRIMPNTPAMVGEGVTAVCPSEAVSEAELAEVQRILGGFGISEVIPERLIDAVVAVSGSSPAYVFMFIEAMADAAVAEGMPRAQAYRFAAQAVRGSAKMVLETGKHPGELKDMVCSPAGTTIVAVQELEKRGFRSAVIEAMRANAAKSRQM